MSPRVRAVGRMLYWLAWPALYVYLRLGARTRVLLVADNHVLLVQGWMSDGMWGLPGGGLHWRENLAKGAVREVREETGVALLPGDLLPLEAEWVKSRGLKFYCHFFVVKLPGMIEPVPQRGEIADAKWVSAANLQAMAVRAEVERALELLGNR